VSPTGQGTGDSKEPARGDMDVMKSGRNVQLRGPD
jgi:hypothetical protein